MGIASIFDSVALKLLVVLSGLYLGFQLGRQSGLKADGKDTSKARLLGESDSDGDDESAADGDLSAISVPFGSVCKLVLVVRKDLKMDTATVAALCSQATLACYKALSAENTRLVRYWECSGQAKVTVKVMSDEELLKLEAMAKSQNLCARAVFDTFGRNKGTRAVLGIGPAPVKLIDNVTGSLKLL